MSKLWIFGDSYSDIDDNYGETQWPLLLAKYLNVDIHNVSENGASCAWLLLKWHTLIRNFNPDDKIILLVPFSGRSLVFKNDPGLSSITCLESLGKEKRVDNKWKLYNKNQIDAFKKYFTYLYDTDINLSIAFGLLNTINNCADMFNTPPLIINTHEEILPNGLLYNCRLANGSTLNINVEEFESPRLWNDIASSGMFLDPRVCHMSSSNHIIFAEKLRDYFLKDITPDLTTGFHKKILSKKDIDKN
jgi:hypothetical protein